MGCTSTKKYKKNSEADLFSAILESEQQSKTPDQKLQFIIQRNPIIQRRIINKSITKMTSSHLERNK